jgi:hypothetical protein
VVTLLRRNTALVLVHNVCLCDLIVSFLLIRLISTKNLPKDLELWFDRKVNVLH